MLPALQSYWLVIHVTTIALASGLLLVPGVASLLYLLRRSGRLAGLADRLPAADVLDRLAYRTTIIAFPLYTFAVIAGAIWAEAAWGRFWGWDPKETVAFVAWVVYAAYLHARATAGWRTGAGGVDQRGRLRGDASSTCSSSTWWSPACTRTPVSADRVPMDRRQTRFRARISTRGSRPTTVG